MATIKFKVNSKDSFKKAFDECWTFFLENKYTNLTMSDKRSLDMNAAIRVAYKQIQDNWEGMTGKDIERHCKLNYGVPILKRDCPIHADVFNQIDSLNNYEQMILIMDAFKVTSEFSTSQGNEFIQSMMNDFPYIVIEKPS